MKWIKAWAASAAVLLLLVVAGVFWLFYTPSGVHILLAGLSRFSAAKVSAADMRGYLAKGVSFTRLRIDLPETKIAAERVNLSCSPAGLFLGRLDLKGLSGEAVEVAVTGKKNEPLSFVPPRVPFFLAALKARVRRFAVRNLRYVQDGEETFSLSRVEGRADWRRGELSLQEVKIEMPAGRVAGRFDLGLYRFRLKSELWIDTKDGPADLNKFFIRTNLKPSLTGTTMTGPVKVWAYRNTEPRATLKAFLSASRNRLDVRDFALGRTDCQGLITGNGRIATDKPTTSFSAAARIDQFRLGGPADGIGAISGSVGIDGASQAYGGRFEIKNGAQGWRTFKASGAFQGDNQQVRVELEPAEWLSGYVTGKATIDWRKGIGAAVDLSARGLNTGLIDATWQGVVNGETAFRFHRTGSGATTATVNVGLSNSTFRQQPLKGVISAAYEKDVFRLNHLTLQGRGFDVTAQGILSQNIGFHANLQDLSSFIPHSRGMVTGRGWFRYANNRPAMGISGNGRDIRYKDLKVNAVQITAGLDETGTKDVNLDVAGRSISYKGVDVNTLQAIIKGKLTNHNVNLTLTGPTAGLRGKIVGGYEKGVWTGSFTELMGSDRQRGEWRLENPTRLTFSAAKIVMDKLILKSVKGEQLIYAMDLQLSPLSGFVKADWYGVDVSRFDPIMPVSFDGKAKGHIFLQWAKGKLTQVMAGLTSQGGRLRHEKRTTVLFDLGASIDWTAKGLQGTGEIAAANGGGLRVNISSSAAPRLDIPENGRFSSAWQGLTLALLNPFLPVSTSIEGIAAGRADGRFLPERGFVVETFNTRISQGVFTQKTPAEVVTVNVLQAGVDGGWREKNLNARVRIDAGRMGNMEADVLLPIPARLPMTAIASGPVKVDAKGRIHDMRLVGVLLPESLHKPEGRTELIASLHGTWERPTMNASLSLHDSGVTLAGTDIAVRGVQAKAVLSWTGQGLVATADAQLSSGGVLTGSVTSSAPPRMGLPDRAAIAAQLRDMNIALLKPLLPQKLDLTGRADSSLQAHILPGRGLTATLDAKIRQGAFTFRTDKGAARTSIGSASIQADLNGETLKGQVRAELGNQGRLKGTFLLPIRARLPLHPVPDGPVRVTIKGQVQEEGMLSVFFPGLIQETKGAMTMDAQILGTWDHPSLSGSARLSDAAAYLPTAGAHVKAVNATLEFSENNVNIRTFRAESGTGRIDGSGTVSFKGGHIEKYSGKLEGNRFQAVYLPDLRVLVSPSITFSGTSKLMTVEGNIDVPQLLVYGPPTENVVKTSPDVVFVDRQTRKPQGKQKLPIDLQAMVKVRLGDDVRIRMQGVDARLDGTVALNIKGMDDVRGTGEINIVEGRYNAYGVELQITRGHVTFSGPIEKGRLDILAARKIEGATTSSQLRGLLTPTQIGSTKITGVQPTAATNISTQTQMAGVQIAGILERPRISLYSTPPLSDADTLSYIVLGKPVSGDAAQASMLFSAAGGLLGQGQAGSVQEQLKKMLGLQTLEVASEKIATQQGQVEQTMVRIGRYLAPNLYIGFGRSLFTNDYVVTARYNLSKKWEIQTRTGTQTGGDIFYKVEFD